MSRCGILSETGGVTPSSPSPSTLTSISAFALAFAVAFASVETVVNPFLENTNLLWAVRAQCVARRGGFKGTVVVACPPHRPLALPYAGGNSPCGLAGTPHIARGQALRAESNLKLVCNATNCSAVESPGMCGAKAAVTWSCSAGTARHSTQVNIPAGVGTVH